MYTQILNVLNSFKATGLVAFLIAVIPATYKLVKPLIEAKIKTEKNTHIKQGMELGLKLANAFVPVVASMPALSNSDRKKAVNQFIDSNLKKSGFDFKAETIEGLAEQAYQYYKHTLKGDNHKAPVTPAPTNDVSPETPIDDDPEVFKEPQSSEQK
ncbi:hypothetical protein EFR99_05535 [Lentilactobacillus buchneri]|uniref:hypothetical protein n=1 Tax=Lentilactobacillus buchneri TaxID=1581 RepID=UPI0021A343BF|nr:hypothetical protein [Lentilactobacillus buchneri]MCT3559850.1 hypothetical protein [Lentilactobacillus buchneri]